MPARIDPEQRRKHVVAAALRLVVAEGIDGLSLRKVAVESGLNIGSVRHYFDDHTDLLAAAAREVGDRMDERLACHPLDDLTGRSGPAALEALQELVEELLPVDEQRRVEAIVLGEFIVAARTKPVFRPMAEQMATDMRQVLADALDALAVPDPGEEAERLTAMCVGLSLDAVTPHGSLSVERVRRTLRRHLHSIPTG